MRNIFKILNLIFVSLSLIPIMVTAGEKQYFPSDTDIQALIQSRIDHKGAIGIVVGLIEADGSTRVFTAGESGHKSQPLSELSVFEIGSITKVFTSILLADMVAKDELTFEDPVAKFLPKDKVTMPTRAGKEILLLDLSTHYSGLPRMPDNFKPADASNPFADYTIEQMYDFLSNHNLRRDIGEQAEYSNIGVGLLGHVLARVNSSTYEELLRNRILEPLGMKQTVITMNDYIRKLHVKGHDQEGNVVPNWDIVTLEGAGALRSNMKDMLKFMAANIGPAESPLEEAMRTSHEVRKIFSGNMDIGLNWIILNQGDNKIIWHNGGTGGYHSFAGFDPVKRVAIVLLTNSSHDNDDIGLHLLNPSLPLREPPKERTEVKVAANILDSYIGEYQLQENFIITITVEGGTIWAQATGQSNFQIYPESKYEFFYKVVDAQITFEANDAGEITALVLHQGGADMRAPKQ